MDLKPMVKLVSQLGLNSTVGRIINEIAAFIGIAFEVVKFLWSFFTPDVFEHPTSDHSCGSIFIENCDRLAARLASKDIDQRTFAPALIIRAFNPGQFTQAREQIEARN